MTTITVVIGMKHTYLTLYAPNNRRAGKVIMEPVKWSATEALSQLDKVDYQFVKGIINEGDRNGQRLVIMLNLIAWAKMETIINIAEA